MSEVGDAKRREKVYVLVETLNGGRGAFNTG